MTQAVNTQTFFKTCSCRKCGVEFTVERKSKRGRNPDLCPSCKSKRTYLSVTNRTSKIAMMHRYVTERFLSIRAYDDRQSILNALYLQIRNDRDSISNDFRMMLTNKASFMTRDEQTFKAFATIFYAFAVTHHGNVPARILAKNLTEDQRNDMIAKEQAADAMREARGEVFRRFEGSALDYLTHGFEPDFCDDLVEDFCLDDVADEPEAMEAAPAVSPKAPAPTEADLAALFDDEPKAARVVRNDPMPKRSKSLYEQCRDLKNKFGISPISRDAISNFFDDHQFDLKKSDALVSQAIELNMIIPDADAYGYYRVDGRL